MATQSPSIRKLAGQTVIYGLSSVLGRAVSFLLLPIYTGVFSTTEYGIQSLVYVYAPVLFVFYLMRIDTAYFRFATEEKWKSTCFNTAFSAVGLASLVLSVGLFFGAPYLTTNLFNIPVEYIYVIRLMAIILFFDGLSEIPFARLRLENKAGRFASIRVINIFVNVGLNCFLLLFIPWYIEQNAESTLFSWYDAEVGIGYIFISNLVASVLSFVLLSPQWMQVRFQIDQRLLLKIWSYAYPLVIVALAGIVNELIDRVLLDRLLPYDDTTNKAMVGIYSAAYKFSILISLFTQAYRYAAEPFFFSHARNKNAPKVYAQAAEYFVLAACFGFLCIMFFMPLLKYLLRQPEYHEGVVIVPILIMANIFLGIYYNLSVWYKLSDKTKYAMYIALGGASLTLLLNFVLIPWLGYLGSAWATLGCYSAMTYVSYFIGKQHYDLQHDLRKLSLYMIVSVALYFGVTYCVERVLSETAIQMAVYSVVLVILSGLVYWIMAKRKRVEPDN